MGGHEKLIMELNKGDLPAIKKEGERVRAEYEYLNDGMPLETWVWEFIRRNPHYITLFNDIKHDFVKFRDDLNKEDNFESQLEYIADGLISKKLEKLADEFGIRALFYEKQPHDANNFMVVDGLKLFIVIPNPSATYDAFCCHYPMMYGTSAVIPFKFDPKMAKRYEHLSPDLRTRSFNKDCRDIMLETLAADHFSDTLYLGVSLNANKDDIYAELKSIVNHHFKHKATKRKRKKEWKYYLVAHDLSNAGKDYSEIVDIMGAAFSEDGKANDKLFDMENIENYHDEALKLINGKFREILYKKKKSDKPS